MAKYIDRKSPVWCAAIQGVLAGDQLPSIWVHGVSSVNQRVVTPDVIRLACDIADDICREAHRRGMNEVKND